MAALLLALQLPMLVQSKSCTVHIHHTLGCYNDSDWHEPSIPAPVLPHFMPAIAGDKLTLASCALACGRALPVSAIGGVFGVEAGTRCFCGNATDLAFAQARAVPKSQCLGTPCGGNKADKECGTVGRLLAVAYTCDATPPPAPSPPKPSYIPQMRHLPSIDGVSFPPWSAVFTAGECDADDRGSPAYGPYHLPGATGGYINSAKRCYSCFRIPSITVNPKTGTLHAFAEARRGDVHGSHCPDIPDTRIAYKRSTDNGASWSALRILHHVEGRCHQQPTPVFDNVTNVLIMAFNDGCSHYNPYRGVPKMTTSADDGLTWTNATAMPASRPGTGTLGTHTVIGLSRGFALYNQSLPSKTRLVIPAETGPIFSDDHGKSWTAVPSSTIGESAMARCTGGACSGAPGGRANFAMAVREGPPYSVSIKFSNDSLHWTAPRPLPGIAPYSNYGQAPGLIATPGGLVLSHGGKGNASAAMGREQLGSTGHGDSNGCDLFESTDGVNWKLLRHIWPFQTGYTTMVETEVDNDGAAQTFALISESGGIMESDQMLVFFNFTV